MVRLVFVLTAVAIFSQSDISIIKTLSCTSNESQTDCKPCRRPDPNDMGSGTENKWPDVTDLEISRRELALPSPIPGASPQKVEYSSDMVVSIKTTAADPENDVMTYKYTVSGGRIVGTGPRVSWDLNGVASGVYTITAAVDDGCGLCGAKLTKTIMVTVSGADPPLCSCMEIKIVPSKQDQSNDFVFSANLNGRVIEGLKYNWSISEGTLVSGQGTPSIRVSPPKKPTDEPRTVTVEIADISSPACGCPIRESISY